MLLDNRSAKRVDCLIEAEIVLPGLATGLPCLVKDISEDGARLELAKEELLPKRFDLVLPPEIDIVDGRSVELRWQSERTVGVRFNRS